VPASEAGTLRLSGVLEADQVAELWPTLQRRTAALERIDLSAVTDLDSSGVALVRHLIAAATAAGGRPALVGAPARYAQIGLAHRLEAGGD
jgi:phospholipid transport system transporter-binding protein